MARGGGGDAVLKYSPSNGDPVSVEGRRDGLRSAGRRSRCRCDRVHPGEELLYGPLVVAAPGVQPVLQRVEACRAAVLPCLIELELEEGKGKGKG